MFNFYDMAESKVKSANVLLDSGQYLDAIYLYCLATEFYLKSKLKYVKHDETLEGSHDIVNISKALLKSYPTKKDLNFLKQVRKYMNESRYPFNDKSFNLMNNSEFVIQFKKYCEEIKSYIDEDVVITVNKMQQTNYFTKE